MQILEEMARRAEKIYQRVEGDAVMNGKWTKENFNLHDEKNPAIYELFVKFALQVAKRRSYYSAKNIFHRMRWETMIEEKESEFKIDDGWISHYARKFVNELPTV
jgi:hypothetical protein